MEKTQLLFAVATLLGCFLSLPLYADTVNEVSAWVNENQCQMEAYMQEAKQLREGAEIEVLKLMHTKKPEEKSCRKEIEVPEQSRQETNSQEKPAILIFVSLSLPKESLKNLYREAEVQGLPLLIRGLKNNSFKETAQALRELEIAVQIDPTLFEEYGVTGAPTFVRCDKKESLKLQGNISLGYAQQKFEEAS